MRMTMQVWRIGYMRVRTVARRTGMQAETTQDAPIDSAII